MAKLIFILMAAVVVASGCASAEMPREFEVPAGRYSEAFDATRAVLRDFHFKLERIDASAGVVSTQSKATSGWATPWDPEQSFPEQEWEDFANRQERRVRVTFLPKGESLAGGDLREAGKDLVGRVEVVVERMQRPNWRPSAVAVRQSSTAVDPDLAARGMSPQFMVPVARDAWLERRICEAVRERLAKPPEPEAEKPEAEEPVSQ